MKFHRLTFFAALFLTAAMLLVAIFFYLYEDQIYGDSQNWILKSVLAISCALVFNYFVLEFLFGFYGKKQIKKISTILPEAFMREKENMSFQTLSERVTEYSQKNASEMDTMKEMENYRKEYIGNISHEMKTPLFSIQGYVETLMDGGVENLAIRDKYLERINGSVERLLNIVTDLDMINKYESGEISLNKNIFDINSLVKEVFDLLDLEATKRGAKLTLQTSVNPLFVLADKQKISQVLINLISNAVNYSNREKATIKAVTQIANGKASIKIQDNGMGIKPENLPRIFERFFRVETSRNRKEGGSGLGLAIVKHILDAHQQEIHVESVYLEGTVFTFTLPLAE